MRPELAQHFRLRPTPTRTTLEIETIRWAGADKPYSEWKPFRSWPTPPSDTELATAKREALADARFFRTCTVCRELLPQGQTMQIPTDQPSTNATICHGCAETKSGILLWFKS